MKAATDFFPGNSAMHLEVCKKDWSQTLLGPISTWPDGICTAVSISLNSQFQLVVLSGPEFVYIYNDASIPIFGDKHPWALGQRAVDVWPEVWSTIGPLLNAVLTTGKATRQDDLLLVLQRRGFSEECYFTFSYSPILLKDNSVGGVFVAVLETTSRVVNERRLRTLGALAIQVAQGSGQSDTFQRLKEVLSRNPYDIPFAALYQTDADGGFAELVFSEGFTCQPTSLAPRIPLRDDDGSGGGHPVKLAALTRENQVVDSSVVLSGAEVCGVWPEQPRQCMVLPFVLPGQNVPRGFLMVGLNPRKDLDDEYRAFFGLLVGHVTTAVANIEAIEAERRRTAAMVELDRSKSQFFSTASHELRTPVALIIGPLNEVLDHDRTLSADTHESLEMVRRNARRLHKLVNAIMDFASIEAGRLSLRLEPTDIGMLTAEIASLFRSAAESAGLGFSVHCDVPCASVLVDREMWEKVILNLLSNALKFTPSGSIDVVLQSDDRFFTLSVRDTGYGISQEDLPHIFERFFRGQSMGRRSVEGSGIGLALVHELVRLHGGHVDVESEPGKGSVFTVMIPLRIASPTVAADTMEPDSSRESVKGQPALPDVIDSHGSGETRIAELSFSGVPALQPEQMKILIIDDNEDMVRYIERLLENTCVVISAGDGVRGLEAIRRYRPDLVLMDIMMPQLDGFEVLKQVRADAEIHTVSLIVLSASAGDEARLEALQAGADDYLVKPFKARELIARVHSHIQMKRIRRAAARREDELRQQLAEVRNNLETILEGANEAYIRLDRNLRILGLNEAAAQALNAHLPDMTDQVCSKLLLQLRGTALEAAMRDAVDRRKSGSLEYFNTLSGRWFNVRCHPAPEGVIVFADDITERKDAEEALRAAHAELEQKVIERTQELLEANKLLAAVFDRAPVDIAITDIQERFVRANAVYQDLLGYTADVLSTLSIQSVTDPEHYPEKHRLLQSLLDRESRSFQIEMRYRRRDGLSIWVNSFVSTIDDEAGRPCYFVKIAQDITVRKQAEQEVLSSQQELGVLYETLKTVREEERKALAREVHDQLGQVLSAAKIDIKLLEDDVRPAQPPVSQRRISTELRSARRTLDKAIQIVQRISTELRASELEDQGLYAAIEWHARDFERRTRIKCHLALPENVREPNGAIATTLFRIFQESMTNILRHAKAAQVWISLVRRGNSVLLRVRDDGIGISMKNVRSGRSIGLTGMRERAAIAGGRLLIGKLRPRGTLVTARIPLAGEGLAAPARNHDPRNPGNPFSPSNVRERRRT